MGHFYHLFANGDDAKNFITSDSDFEAAFNRFAVCSVLFPEVSVYAFSIEESHPHALIYGSYEDCLGFKRSYEDLTRHFVVAGRGNLDCLVLEIEMRLVDDPDYLLNTAAYVLVQPTKDGKQVMPYDYRWGTASMYFRPEGYPPIWCFDENWKPQDVVPFGSLSFRQKRAVTHSRLDVPDDWNVSGGIILPSNYVAVKEMESVFKTFNRFRTYMSAGRSQLQPVLEGMAQARGIAMTDLEARKLSGEISLRRFGKRDSSRLSPTQRLELATELRNNYHVIIRQVASLTRLPESEIRKYLR